MNKLGSKRGLRFIAILEAVKGAVVLFVACGMPHLTHHKTALFVERLVVHSRLDPAHHYPQVFINLAKDLDSGRLWWLAAGATLYALVRFVEAYGLWMARRWAEWVGCVGAAMYIPLEYQKFINRPDKVSGTILVSNIIVVIYLALCLKRGVGKKPVDYSEWEGQKKQPNPTPSPSASSSLDEFPR